MVDFIHNGKDIPDAPTKDPDSTIDYGANWAGHLREGEVIASSVWLVPAPLVSESESFTGTETKVLLSGGVAGTKYTVTNRVTTSLGMVDDRSMVIMVRDK